MSLPPDITPVTHAIRYLCLFSTSLPAETVARGWDALFNEGPKILYRVALALLKVEEETLLKFDNAGGYSGAS